MDLIISILLSTRILTFLGGLSASQTQTYFAPPQITVSADSLRLSCWLKNGYSEELRELAKTGTPIRIYLFAELLGQKNKSQLSAVTIESSLSYDVVNRYFLVFRSHIPETLIAVSLDSAIALSCAFENIALAPVSLIDKSENYSILTYAVLGKASVEALHKRQIDLMYYWNFKRPTMKTEKIAGSRILALKKE